MKEYRSLFLAITIHFFVMYALTYAAVHTWADVSLFSTRSFYMAGLMVAPMVFLMLFFMRHMYRNRILNAGLYLGSIAAFVLFFFFIREQIFVGDTQFLHSMIPHHSSAITMCEEASITDPEIIGLCEDIVETQKQEIEQMRTILDRFNTK